MSKNTIWILVVIVIAAGALFFMYGSGPQTAPLPSATQPSPAPTAASDNPDTIVNNILNDSQISLTPLETNPSLTAPDSDITNGFDQAADTTNL